MNLNEFWESFSEEEKQENIEYMLQNDKLVAALRNWKIDIESVDTFLEMVEAFLDSIKRNAGLIIAIKSEVVKTGADNIEFLTGIQSGEIQRAVADNGKSYAMVFTSRKHFKECCDDLSGIILFMDEILINLEQRKEIDGIVINAGKEEVVLNKMIMRAIIGAFKHI